MSDAAGQQAAGEDQPDTFTQEQVNQLVGQARQDERRKATNKFADYDDLKAKAEGAKTVEQQLTELRDENQRIQRDNLAARIAAQHGIPPEDADLFLTGTDEQTLTAQATRLAARATDRKKQGNLAPREGHTTKVGEYPAFLGRWVRGQLGLTEPLPPTR